MGKCFDFIGIFDSDVGEITVNNTEGQKILSVTGAGTLTLYGPEGEVLRVYEESEINQRDIDAEATSLLDMAYEPTFGEAVMRAFSTITDMLEEQLDVVPIPPTPQASIN